MNIKSADLRAKKCISVDLETFNLIEFVRDKSETKGQAIKREILKNHKNKVYLVQ